MMVTEDTIEFNYLTKLCRIQHRQTAKNKYRNNFPRLLNWNWCWAAEGAQRRDFFYNRRMCVENCNCCIRWALRI